MTTPPSAHRAASPEAAFAAALASDPGGPMITYYDVATGERVELSARSLANWVAKTHHLLSTSLGLGPGDVAYAALPTHWMSAVALLGAFSAGLCVADDPAQATTAQAAFVTESTAPAAIDAGAPEIFALSLAPLGRPFDPSPPPGCEDFVLSVRPMPDAWASVHAPAAGDDPAICAEHERLSRAQAMADALSLAESIGLSPDGRLRVDGEQDWRSWLLAPLAAGASIVLIGGADPASPDGAAAIARIGEAERVTAILS